MELNRQQHGNQQFVPSYLSDLTVAISFPDEPFKTVVFKDGKLQLLLKLMGCERIGERDDPESIWIVGQDTSLDDLETHFRLLKQYIDEPPTFEDGKTGADLLRRKAAPRAPREPDTDDSGIDSDSDSDSDSDTEGKKEKKAKKAKKSSKRKRREVDDEELAARREKRTLADLEKRAEIKSAVRIVDSDDDEEADLEFFARERELKERMARRAEEGNIGGAGTKKVSQKKGKKKKVASVAAEYVDVEIMGGTQESLDPEILSVEDVDDLEVMRSSEAREDNNKDDGSENGDIENVRPSKKRKIRRAVSISSDED